MGRQLNVKCAEVDCVYEYISRIVYLHVDSLFQDLLRCCVLVKSVSVSTESDGKNGECQQVEKPSEIQNHLNAALQKTPIKTNKCTL